MKINASNFRQLILLLFSLIVCGTGTASEYDWSEGDAGAANGATRDYFNGAAFLSWDHQMGDWKDRNDVAHGKNAFATAIVVDDDTEKDITWDVTNLVHKWIGGTYQNQGFFLRATSEQGKIIFSSREHENLLWHPTLLLEIEGEEHLVEPQADTYLDKSTYRSQGTTDHLRISVSSANTLLRFDLSQFAQDKRPSKATLRLHTTKQYGTCTIGVFRCQQGDHELPSEPIQGLAEKYPQDQKIESDPDVLFATRFEKSDWAEQWTYTGARDMLDTVSKDPSHSFLPLDGKAVRVQIEKGKNLALNSLWKFRTETGSEPTECYFRYYLQLGDDWNQTIEDGKLPGVSGTYGKTGWGGRRSFGDQGWSARGLYKRTIPAGNPLAGRTPIGTYAYHADMPEKYGTHWLWQIGNRGYLENNRWYAIEQYVKLNSPGKRDGILRAWVDGRAAFEKTDIRFRNTDMLKIEQIWMNVYHGGKKTSPHDQHLFIDNVVIARSYIGPICP